MYDLKYETVAKLALQKFVNSPMRLFAINKNMAQIKKFYN